MKINIVLGALLMSSFCIGQNTFPATGNVGIGTNTPETKLDVKGTIKNYEPTPLGDPVGSVLLVNEIGGRAGTGNSIYKRLWFYRDNASSSNWWTARFHDGISVDGTLNTPQVDTRTWWERDPNDDIQSWGNANSTYLTINKGNVGIGTINPSTKLDIYSSSATILKISNIDPSTYTTQIHLGGSSGFAKSAIISSPNSAGWYRQDLFFCLANGNNTSSVAISDAAMVIKSYNSGQFGYVGIGTISPDEKLTVKGKIHTQEVRVDMNGPLVPDYVFAEDYKLKTLKEVEDYVKVNSHLPEIPSAKEIEKNGLMLAEMNMALLKKIEEMTLYMIDFEKELKILKSENEIQKEEINKLKEINKPQ
jgi:hypothetical protein